MSIEVPPNAETNDDIDMLFTNLIENNVVLSIVSILLFKDSTV